MDTTTPFPVLVAGVPVDRPEPEIHVLAALQDVEHIFASQRLLGGLGRISPRLASRAQPLRAPLSTTIEEITTLRDQHKKVALLADGDPLFFGIGATLVRALGKDGVRVLPAISSLQAACARLNLPWHDVVCLSLHGRDNWQPLFAAAGKGKPICVLTDARATPPRIAHELVERGVRNFVAHVFTRMGAQDERVRHADLAVLAQSTESHECFAADTTLVLEPTGNAPTPTFGLAGREHELVGPYHSQASVRAAALHLLQVEPRHTVWDVGAGTGAVALDACALARDGQVVAVENNEERVGYLRTNRRHFGAAILEICHGQAPDCLAELPDPDRVFIGGGLGGKNAEAIVEHVVDRLPVGGRLVISCVLLQTLTQCRSLLDGLGLASEIVQIQASAASPLGNDVHFVAQNPVFLLAASKKGS